MLRFRTIEMQGSNCSRQLKPVDLSLRDVKEKNPTRAVYTHPGPSQRYNTDTNQA
jgi:hypothetical protein